MVIIIVMIRVVIMINDQNVENDQIDQNELTLVARDDSVVEGATPVIISFMASIVLGHRHHHHHHHHHHDHHHDHLHILILRNLLEH